MTEKIEAILKNECGLTKDRPIIVGVSGGPDSLCLMETLRQAGYPSIVAYFDHQLRPESTRDARMVEKIATRLMLACVLDGADVRGYSEENKLSIEEAARNLRYRFLFDLARRHNAQAVAVGHTADDQVETVLMHFLRGSGISGLKGMSYRTVIKSFDPEIPIVRPLLDLWREETEVYCAVHGLRPHYDSSNDLLNFQRNRIRHLLIPTLETYNPKLREAILRMSQSLTSDYTFVMETLEKAWQETLVSEDEDTITFDADRLSACSLGLQRNLVKHAMQTLAPGVDITFSVLERALHTINSPLQSSRVDLKGGMRLFHEANRVFICTSDAELPFDLWPQIPNGQPLVIPCPGQVVMAGGWKVTCERWRLPALAKEQAERNEDQFQVWLDAEDLPETFELRVRRQGDHFSPLGMDDHSQKLSDFFVNEKLPQRARDRWPLLCAGEEVVWVPGYRPAHRHRLKTSTNNVIYFSMARPPEKIVPEENPRQ
ncbi:MAG: tRNA lysidine(34) synthetase TilS [Anaerolineales bacterium]|nr:tRNA lysidine(34) synthetase TilS [Anaerolineales bacterium]